MLSIASSLEIARTAERAMSLLGEASVPFGANVVLTRSTFPLLADTDKAVAALYGTLGPLGFPRRSVFIIDREGIIRYAHRAIAGLTYRPVRELIAELEKLH